MVNRHHIITSQHHVRLHLRVVHTRHLVQRIATIEVRIKAHNPLPIKKVGIPHVRLCVLEQIALLLLHTTLQRRLIPRDHLIDPTPHISRQPSLRDVPLCQRDLLRGPHGEAERRQHHRRSLLLQHREVDRLQVLVQRRYTSRHGRIPT